MATSLRAVALVVSVPFLFVHLVWPLGVRADGDDPFTFQVSLVDSTRTAQEPTISVAGDDTIWIGGYADDANVWHAPPTAGSGFVYEHPPLQSGHDGAVLAGPANTVYFAALRAGAGGLVDVASGVVSGGGVIWNTNILSIDKSDRPWLFADGTDVFLVNSNTTTTPPHPDLYRTQDEGDTWNFLSEIEGAPNAGSPAVSPNGTIAIPLHAGGSAAHSLAVSLDGVNWSISTIPGASGDSLPRGASDAAGNFYVTWTDGANVYYSVLLTDLQTWRGPHAVGGNSVTFGPAIVAGQTGRVALAWYAKAAAMEPWTVRFRMVTDAASEQPVLTPASPKTIDGYVADSGAQPGFAFRDFLSIDALSNGRSVVTYNCQSNILLYCPAGGGYPKVAAQTAGPTL